MKDETIAKVKEQTAGWAYREQLPATWHGFTLDKSPVIGKDTYDLFRYYNEDLHKSAIAYFHEETHEYKLRLKIGLIEFCRIEYITASLDVFTTLLEKQFESLLKDLATFNPQTLSSIVHDKGILTWDEADDLPQEIEGFTLFIRPQEPVRINNGSCIVIDYVNFELESSFTVYYNIFRDEFFAEARIWNIPDVNYDFDSRDLQELSNNLQQKMVPRLQEIHRLALAQVEEQKQEKQRLAAYQQEVERIEAQAIADNPAKQNNEE